MGKVPALALALFVRLGDRVSELRVVSGTRVRPAFQVSTLWAALYQFHTSGRPGLHPSRRIFIFGTRSSATVSAASTGARLQPIAKASQPC